jgi:hypothetical protein
VPTITGTATQGQTLMADTSGIADADGLGAFAYVWKADGTVIVGASASALVLGQAQVGKAITVEVSYIDALGALEGPLVSGATAAVANVNDAPTGVPTITGAAAQGQTLTADTTGIADADGLGAFAYVWKADGTVIAGATSSTLVLSQAQVGKAVTVEVSYTDGFGQSEGPLLSTATAFVSPPSTQVANNGSYSAVVGASDIFVIDPTQSINASIAGFESGDVLQLVSWSEDLGVVFENPVFADGEAVLVVGGATITLTGLASDAFGDEQSFEGIYGPGAITYAVL